MELAFFAEFIVQSELIERIYSDYYQSFGKLARGSKKGHVGALLFLREKVAQDGLLSEDDILSVQRLITSEQPQKGAPSLHARHIGHYRDCNVSVGNQIKPVAAEVPNLMESFIRKVRHWQSNSVGKQTKKSSIAAVSDFHFEFEHLIHPFADGNGRTGRALAYFMLSYAGIPAFVFTNKDAEYYQSFVNKNAMREYFLRKYTSSLDPSLLNLDITRK